MEKSELLSQIGQNIRHRQRDLGLTQEQLAEKSGIGHSFCSEIIRANRAMSIETFYNMVLALETSADYLLFGENRHSDFSGILALLADLDKTELTSMERIIRLCKAEFLRNE